MSSPKQLARIAGLLYLIVGVFGGFAIGYVTPLVYAPGDALTTATNVSANAGLVRASVLADLIQATVFVFLAMVLFAILKDVNRSRRSRDADPRRDRDCRDVPQRGLPDRRSAGLG